MKSRVVVSNAISSRKAATRQQAPSRVNQEPPSGGPTSECRPRPPSPTLNPPELTASHPLPNHSCNEHHQSYNHAHPARGVHRFPRLGPRVRPSLQSIADGRAAPHLRPGDRFEVCSSLLSGTCPTPPRIERGLADVRRRSDAEYWVGPYAQRSAPRYRAHGMFVLRKSTRTSWEQSLGSGLAIALAPAHAQAMVRPRPGSFVYTEAEVEVMLEDIIAFKATGVDGIVFGCLLPNGQVDVETASRCVYLLAALITDDQIGRGRRATTRLAQLWLATLTTVTFHRAFDVTPDWRHGTLPARPS